VSKILLALSILSASAGGFLAMRQSTVEFQREANAAREAWQTETQQVAAAQSQQVSLKEHQEDLRRSLRQRPVVVVDPVWSELKTNLTGRLAVELREKLLRELAFNWQSSPDYIVITKQALRETGPEWIVQNGECSDVAATVFTMTPGERARVEAALKRAQTEFNDWARENVERSGPKNDVLAEYNLPANPSIGTDFQAAVSQALGADRARFFPTYPQDYIDRYYIIPTETTFAIKRYRVGNEIRVEVFSTRWPDGPPGVRYLWENARGYSIPFPQVLRPIFTNGWADVAKLEGFELPKGPPEGVAVGLEEGRTNRPPER
jgi:hypothetical protein